MPSTGSAPSPAAATGATAAGVSIAAVAASGSMRTPGTDVYTMSPGGMSPWAPAGVTSSSTGLPHFPASVPVPVVVPATAQFSKLPDAQGGAYYTGPSQPQYGCAGGVPVGPRALPVPASSSLVDAAANTRSRLDTLAAVVSSTGLSAGAASVLAPMALVQVGPGVSVVTSSSQGANVNTTAVSAGGGSVIVRPHAIPALPLAVAATQSPSLGFHFGSAPAAGVAGGNGTPRGAAVSAAAVLASIVTAAVQAPPAATVSVSTAKVDTVARGDTGSGSHGHVGPGMLSGGFQAGRASIGGGARQPALSSTANRKRPIASASTGSQWADRGERDGGSASGGLTDYAGTGTWKKVSMARTGEPTPSSQHQFASGVGQRLTNQLGGGHGGGGYTP